MAVGSFLSSGFGGGRSIRHIERRPSPYRSSYVLDELDLAMNDGTLLKLMFKDCDRGSMPPEARDLKSEILYDSTREISVYRDILNHCAMGTPAFYGEVVDPDRCRYWLFTERVEGQELYQIGETEIWQQAARWLAVMHRSFSDRASSVLHRVPLLDYNRTFFQRWMNEAVAHLQQMPLSLDLDISMLVDQFDKAVERITSLPATFLHGEFYPSNILVGVAPTLRICPVDWEMAAIGPGLMDLAALISGRWTEQERRTLISSYASHLGTDVDEQDLEYCRLCIAVQWLGVFGSREPYWQHKHDWLREAFELAERLAKSNR